MDETQQNQENENQEVGTNETDNIQTTEIQEYNQEVLSHLQNIDNAITMNSFFMGAILGALIISLFFKRINP